MAGGVSAALEHLWQLRTGSRTCWWYVKERSLALANCPTAQPLSLITFTAEMIDSHYRYCNEFLWPVMHDLPQYAVYRPEDREQYDRLNRALGRCILRWSSAGDWGNYFVQDYQLAGLPAEFRRSINARSIVFWHIPWPRAVRGEHLEPVVELARKLLLADGIGFQTEEYAHNFISFLEENLPEFHWNRDSSSVDWIPGTPEVNANRQFKVLSGRLRPPESRRVQIIVAPLGLDLEYWRSLACQHPNTVQHPALMKTPFVLSVDRADFTKGVTNRIAAIDRFFERYEQWRGRVVFLQVCGQSRAGIPTFDIYWDECRMQAARLNARWASNGWRPLQSTAAHLSSAELALLYLNASAMLVNPLRDGLNLTAKEYVACQGSPPGVLMLSPYAGAWSELGEYALPADPTEPEKMAANLHRALTMGPNEKSMRMCLLQGQLEKNTLSQWCSFFEQAVDGDGQTTALPTFLKDIS